MGQSYKITSQFRPRCPRCCRGAFADSKAGRRGTGWSLESTGEVDTKKRRTSAGQYRVKHQLRCLDCGHTWWSVHPDGPVYLRRFQAKGGEV